MKVEFLKQYTDEFNFTFEIGWTAELTDPHAERLIAQQICVEAAKNTRPSRSTKILTTCFPEADTMETKSPRKRKDDSTEVE